MTLNLTVPRPNTIDFVPKITVIGVGGGGNNAIDNMITQGLQGVDFVAANTDAQQLHKCLADRRIQLGPHITQGLGAGAMPEIGRAAAEEAADELYRHLDNTHMVFVTAGMGGGTGTGAAPVIARMARERNILTVGVVTKPFDFEGRKRARAAEAGIEELQQYVDTLIVIPNQNLFRLANEHTAYKAAFRMADQVLYMGVRGVTDLMVTPGLVNLDFADIRAVMAEMGNAMMGTGEATGENRAVLASEAAINNPLLEDSSMAGARGLLINITGGEDMTLFEVDQAANRIRQEVDEDANIIFGSAIDPELTGTIRVSVVATGIDSPMQLQRPRLVATNGVIASEQEQEPAVSAGFVPAGPQGVGPTGFGVGRMPARPPHLGGAFSETPSFVPQPAPRAAEPAMQSAPAAPPPHSPAPAPTLFNDRPAAAPRGMPMPQPPQKASLFSIVTDVFRRPPVAAPAPARAEAPRVEPVYRAESAAVVRAVTAEDPTLEIPAFLRRQSN